MIARAEMSTNAQSPQGEKSATRGMNVALIGPNDAHRQIVARALASTQGRKVHEFIDYPEQLNDLPRMFDQKFDFVLVDVDTDESYALQIIEALASIGQSVMAYSARTDQELLMACMRAGARDFLPLPTESGAEGSRPEQGQTQPPAKPATVAVPPVTAKPIEPKPVPVPAAPVARFNLSPIITEKPVEPAAENRPMRFAEEHANPEIARVIEEVTISTAPETSTSEKAPSEFAAWDAANLRPVSLPPTPTKRTESRPRPALVPERRKTEAAPRSIPGLETSTVPAIERPPVAVELFRSSAIQSEAVPDEADEKQGANWVKWILIAAGPLVLALVLLVVFTRQSAPSPTANSVKATPPAPTQSAEQTVASPTAAIPKPVAGSPLAVPPASRATSDAVNAPDSQTTAAPVSPDAMAAQLVAPTRIKGQIKTTAPVDEPPPSAPAAVSMDESGAVPGAVFGAQSKAKVEPHVVAISAGVADGMILRKTAPVYPKFAQDAHITGKVNLKATITKQGTIEGIQVLSGPKILAPAAVDAVKTWRYRPYMLDGQPVSVETNVTVVFGSGSK
jgi:periplasmic protein TonB